MARYYGEFIPNLSAIAQPLDVLTKKSTNVVEKWDAKAEDSFNKIKKALTEAPVLVAPDFTKEFFLYTDASNEGIGAVLCQKDVNGKEHPIRFASKSLNSAERNYATIEQEALAVHWAVTKFAEYFDGNRKFTVITDHNPLVWLMKARNWNKKLERWSLALSSYWFDVIYRKGKDNVVADALSRIKLLYPKNPKLSEPTEEELEGKILIGQGEFSQRETKYYQKSKQQYQPPNVIRPEVEHVLKQITIHQQEKEENIEQATEAEIKSRTDSYHFHLMENIKKAQQADAQVNRILSGIELQQLNQRTSVDTTGYFKRDGILYHTEPATIENKQAITQLVIPASMKEEILTFYHDSPFGGGHGGILRTYNKIKVRYYWNDLHKDVINYVGRCIKCTERKNRHWSFTVPGMARNPALYPMHTIAIDYVGPLPLSGTEKFKYVMVIVDQHSRFTICVPVKNKSAATAAQVLIREVFTKYGFPENVLSDNDAAYVADLTKCIFNWSDIHHITTSVYHPQANGYVERFNGGLKTIISMYCNNRTNDWHNFVYFVPLCYNSAIHPVTGYTPFKVFLGREARLPCDLFIGPLKAYQEDLPGADYVSELEIQIKDINDLVNHRWEKDGEKYVTKTLKGKILNFKKGDLVYYQNPGGFSLPVGVRKRRITDKNLKIAVGEEPTLKQKIAIKLKRRWLGPFQIIEKLNNTTYIIRNVWSGPNNKRDVAVHVTRLKACTVPITREVYDNQGSNAKLLEQLANEVDEINKSRGEVHTKVYLGNGKFMLLGGNAARKAIMEAQEFATTSAISPDEEEEKSTTSSSTTNIDLTNPVQILPESEKELLELEQQDIALEQELKQKYKKESTKPITIANTPIPRSTISVDNITPSYISLNPRAGRTHRRPDPGPFITED